MKAIVGFGFFLLFLAGIALVALQGRQMAQRNMPGGGAGMTGKSWRPTVIGAESMPEDSGMFVQFAVDGSVEGHGGCNSFSGSLEQSESRVAVGTLAATRKACAKQVMQRETAFIAALQDAAQFEMGGGRLQLLDGSRALLAELVAAEQ
ncbi:MAG: META domain-containing protein [Gammaproteobacteria bacterium]|nr:META domain-containing protein [Gammaproteobacteria bacterium]MDH3375183.1 META domain-containing protein [Gammaproteobacteria bacterium]MDH3410213.1 META domain-containing protein [Gammaproteobacteria bacterium]